MSTGKSLFFIKAGSLRGSPHFLFVIQQQNASEETASGI